MGVQLNQNSKSGPAPWVEALLLVCPVAVTVWFHLAVFGPRPTDENVHLYVARRVAEGAALYQDIHSARPPLALLPLVLGQWAGLSPLLVARGAVVLMLLVTAFLLRHEGRRLFGPWQGTAAAALFLLAPETAARNAYTGIHLVALFAFACVMFVVRKRAFAAGLAGGLGLAAGQHAAILVVGAAVILLIRQRSMVSRFLVGLVAGLGGPLVLAALRAGPSAVWKDLVGNHLYHLGSKSQATGGDLSFFLMSSALENIAWFGLAGVAMAWPVIGQTKELRQNSWLLGALAGLHVLVVSNMTGGLVLYLFPAVPLIALLAAHGLVLLFSTADVRKGAVVGIGMIALTGVCWPLVRDRYEKRDHVDYSIVPIQRQVQMAFQQRLVVTPKIEEFIKPLLRDGDTLFGYPLIVASVALDLDRRVSGELADLAPRWIQMGLVSRKSIIETIERDKVRFFFEMLGVYGRDPVFKKYLSRCYLPPRVFERVEGEGFGVPRVSVYQHIDEKCVDLPEQ